MAETDASSIEFPSRALPLVHIHHGRPTDVDIPIDSDSAWIVECRSCWGTGDEVQYLGSFESEQAAMRQGSLHVHTGRLGTGA